MSVAKAKKKEKQTKINKKRINPFMIFIQMIDKNDQLTDKKKTTTNKLFMIFKNELVGIKYVE